MPSNGINGLSPNRSCDWKGTIQSTRNATPVSADSVRQITAARPFCEAAMMIPCSGMYLTMLNRSDARMETMGCVKG